MSKVREGILDLCEGALLGSTISFSAATIVFISLLMGFGGDKLLNISLFWGFMAFMSGIFYLGLISKRGKK